MPQPPPLVMRWLAPLLALYLLLIQLADPLWAWPATVLYTLYLLIVLAVGVLHLRGRSLPMSVSVTLWATLPMILIVAVYVPSGWNLWNRVLLVIVVVTMQLSGMIHHAPTVIVREYIMVAVSLSLTILATYGIDRTIGLIDGERRPGGLVFPRGTAVTYRTPEFTHTVRINTYGFRGPNHDLTASVDCRVMLLGDSFTYGWGVDYDDTWGVLIEASLLAEGVNVQVMNLGVPGGNTADYATIAQTAVPALSPDVILVGVLQGDDMRQVSREVGVFPRSLTFGEADQRSPITEYVTFHYPFIAERTLLRNVSASTIQRTWTATATGFITGHDNERRARYDALPDEVREWFEDGHVSPHFIQLGIIAPDYWLWPTQPPETLTPYIDTMRDHLSRIRDAAPDAQIIVVSVPHGAYTHAIAQTDLTNLGFDVPPDLLSNSFVDEAIAAADSAGLPFVTVTDTFRAEETPLFYPVDGHFNASGNQRLADALLPTVRDACT